MKTKTENYISKEIKKEWPRGEWDTEPDKKQWVDAKTGYPCLIVRQHNLGHLCGYVGVSKFHPAFEKPYEDVDVDVHGGLTYADKCMHKVCHDVEPGEDGDIWWLGFDHAHIGDLSPGLQSTREKYMPEFNSFHSGDTYKNFKYVTKECESLAEQLKAMETVATKIKGFFSKLMMKLK